MSHARSSSTYEYTSYEPYTNPTSSQTWQPRRVSSPLECSQIRVQRDDTRHVHFAIPSQKRHARSHSTHSSPSMHRNKLSKAPHASNISQKRDPYPAKHSPQGCLEKTLSSLHLPFPHHNSNNTHSILKSTPPQVPPKAPSPPPLPPWKHSRPPPPPPPPPLSHLAAPPTHPTIYILTYSAALLPTLALFNKLLNTQLPRRAPPIRHLYTINAATIEPPSARLCEKYSGISPVLQDVLMRDPAARVAVARAVGELCAWLGGGEKRRGMGDGWYSWNACGPGLAGGFVGEGERMGERGFAGGNVREPGGFTNLDSGRDFGQQGLDMSRTPRKETEIAMSVCCEAGTHRSVAIAERIAQGVRREVWRRGGTEGVKVVVRHVHRIKGWADPY